MWLEFHLSHHLGGWNTNHVVGNPTCIQRVENMMLSDFFNFENWNHIWNSQVKKHVDDGILWVSKRKCSLESTQNSFFLMLWLFFQPLKLPKKYKKFPNTSKNLTYFVWNPLNLEPIWIHKSGQEKNDQNPDTKKVWSLKLKFAVWCVNLSFITWIWRADVGECQVILSYNDNNINL